MNTCAVVWCDRPAVVRGVCTRCYSRYRRGVSPMVPAEPYAAPEDKERLRDEITRRRLAGEGVADIAAAVRVSASTAVRWLRECGVHPGDRQSERAANLWRPWNPKDIEFAVGRTDLSLSDRAAKLGRSVASVVEYIRKHDPE